MTGRAAEVEQTSTASSRRREQARATPSPAAVTTTEVHERAVDPATPAVKSALRTLEILEHLAGAPQMESLATHAEKLSIPKSSLHALLRTMQACGWVETDQTGTLYRLGLRALLTGAAYVESDDVVALAAPVLDQLATVTGETVHLGRLDGSHIIYLVKRESIHEVRLYSRVGRRLPAHATALGKALLATLPRDEVDRRLEWPLKQLTPNTIVGPAQLHEELARVRAQGYAVDNGENATEVRCVAVALSHPTPSVNAISCSVPVSRASDPELLKIRDALFDAARALEVVLGGLRVR